MTSIRPPHKDRVFCVRLPDAIVDRAEQIAQDHDRTLAEVTRSIIYAVVSGKLDLDGIPAVIEPRAKKRHLALAEKSQDWRVRPGYIYFARSNATGLTKIGQSSNPEERVQALRRERDSTITLVKKIPVTDCTGSERKYHEMFASLRQDGEWFLLMDYDLELI